MYKPSQKPAESWNEPTPYPAFPNMTAPSAQPAQEAPMAQQAPMVQQMPMTNQQMPMTQQQMPMTQMPTTNQQVSAAQMPMVQQAPMAQQMPMTTSPMTGVALYRTAYPTLYYKIQPYILIACDEIALMGAVPTPMPVSYTHKTLPTIYNV